MKAWLVCDEEGILISVSVSKSPWRRNGEDLAEGETAYLIDVEKAVVMRRQLDDLDVDE